MQSEFSIKKTNHIIDDWYHIDVLKQKDREELYVKTNKLTRYIKSEKNNKTQVIKKHCQNILKLFDRQDSIKPEIFAAHLAKKSKRSYETWTGAYKSLFYLFKVLSEVKKCPEIFQTPWKESEKNEGKELNCASILRIHSFVLAIVKRKEDLLQKKLDVIELPNVDKDFPKVPKVVLDYICNFLDPASLRNFAATSKRHSSGVSKRQQKIKEEQIERLNECRPFPLKTKNGEFCTELKIHSIYDLYMYFGSGFSNKIKILDLNDFDVNEFDLEFLKNFSSVKQIFLGKEKNIINITKILNNLPNLTGLVIDNCKLIKIEAINKSKAYSKLTGLNLRWNNNLQILSYNFSNLKEIYFSNLKLNKNHLKNLLHFKNLKKLEFILCSTDFANKEANVFEKKLELENYNIIMCQKFKSLPSYSVNNLNLSFSKNIDFSEFIEKFSDVKNLGLSGSNFNDLKKILGFNRLVSLDLSYCNIENFEPLKELPRLSTLYISLYNLKDFEQVNVLSDCLKLKHLGMISENVKNLAGFPVCSRIKVLDLERLESLEDIKDLLKIFPNLKECKLPDNSKISEEDISSLKKQGVSVLLGIKY